MQTILQTIEQKTSATDMTVELVSDMKKFHEVWPKVRELLLEHKEYWDYLYTIEWIEAALVQGVLQLWLLREGAAEDCGDTKLIHITELRRYPKRSVLEVFFTCGENVIKHTDALEVIEQCAVRSGIEVSKITGRKGLEPGLVNRGYQVEQQVYLKWLKDKSKLH